jgi:hypothetical protein
MMEDMIRRFAPLALLTFLTAAIETPAMQAKAPEEAVEVKTVKSAAVTPGAVIRIAGTAGELNIEAWDEPRVEATLTRTKYADADERDRMKKKLERIGLAVEKRGNDIAVDVTTPKGGFFPRWFRSKATADLACRVMVPRNAKLVVRHEDGSVFVYGAEGSIDATARYGDITVQLADPGKFAINARVKIGGVYTDYSGKYRRPVLVGEKFASEAPGGGRDVTLRVAVGGISIVKMGPVPTSGF